MESYITDIREQYPEYNDMSDKDIADALHRKYYADLPKEKVYEKLGIGSGFEGIYEDITESISESPEAFMNMLKSIPSTVKGAGTYVAKEPWYKSLGQAGLGVGEGVASLLSVPRQTARYLGGKFAPDSSFVKRLEQTPTLYELLKKGEESMGVSQAPEAQSLRAITEMLAGAKGLGKLKTAKGRMGALAAEQGGRGEDPLQAALLGLAGEGIAKGIQKAPQMRPSRMISTPLNAEKLEKAMAVTKGTETSLGDVLENPFLKEQFENVLSKTPLSGASKPMQRTAETIKEKGNNLLEKMAGGESPGDVGLVLQDALKKAQNEAQAQKRKNFNEVNKIADEAGVEIGRNNMATAAQEHLEDLRQSPELLREADKKLIDDLQAFTDVSQKNNLRLSNIFRGKLGDRASQAFQEGRNFEYNIYKNLKDAIDSDIKGAIENSGNDKLMKAHKDSMQYYKENIAPFEEPEIMRFTRRGGDPDSLLNGFLRISSVADRSKLLDKLMTKLSPENQKLVPYAYFSRAIDEGELNPLKMRTLHKKLGENQRKSLLPDKDLRQQLEDYSTLVQKNTEPLNIMVNPKTGQRMLSELPWKTLIGGAVGGAFSGIPLGGIMGAMTPGLMMRPLVKYLTSEKSRQKLIKKMIEDKVKGKNPESAYLNNLVSELASFNLNKDEQ